MREDRQSLLGSQRECELLIQMIVSVDGQREFRGAFAEDAGTRRVCEPRVERNCRHRSVVAVGLCIVGELPKPDMPIRRPVEVRVVEEEDGADRRPVPGAVVGNGTQEVDER